MPPKSPGRTPKWKPEEIKQAWKDLKAGCPTASKAGLARQLKMSLSRIRAVLNEHPSEKRRKEKVTSKSIVTIVTAVEQEKKVPKKQGMMFYPDGWNSF